MLAAVLFVLPGGGLAAQDSAADVGPVRTDRFGAAHHQPLLVPVADHLAPGAWRERADQEADTVAADSSGSWPISAGLGVVGGLAGFYLGSFVPYGIVVVPFVGAASGAILGDRLTGGVDPSLVGALLGAVVGTGVGFVPCVTAFCQGAPYTAFVGMGIGAALGVVLAR